MAQRTMVGGTSQVQAASAEIQAFCEEIKEDVLKKLGLNALDKYEAVHYKSQLVAGTNYFVKVKIDDSGKCVHLRMFEALPCNKDANSKSVELTSLQADKQLDEEIAYF